MRVIALVGHQDDTQNGNNHNCPSDGKSSCECTTIQSVDKCSVYGEPDYINIYGHRRTLSEPELFVAVVGQYSNKTTSVEHLNKCYSLPPKKKKKKVHW